MESFENDINVASLIESHEDLSKISNKDNSCGEENENIEVEVLNFETILQDDDADPSSSSTSAQHFVAESLEEMKAILQNYTEKTSFRFITQCQDKNFKLPCRYHVF